MSYSSTSSTLPVYKELDQKSKRCCDGINKTLHLIANEPTLGLFRIQQHVRKNMPKLDACQDNMKSSEKVLNGLIYDTSSAVEVVKDIGQTQSTFNHIEELLRRASTSAALINMKHNPTINR